MWWWMSGALAHAGPFEGTWVFDGGETERQAIEKTVDSGAQRFNFALRPIARMKLTKVCALDETIEITGTPTHVEMIYRGANGRTAGGPSDGSQIELDGNLVRYTVTDTRLTVDGKNANGGKLSVYELVAPDRMTATHTIRSSTLGDEPLSWTVSYRRRP